MHGTKPAALDNPGNKLPRSKKIGTGETKKDLQLRVVGRRPRVTGKDLQLRVVGRRPRVTGKDLQLRVVGRRPRVTGKDLQLRVVGRRPRVTGVCALRELIA
jgi:hypothetical protein